ncbi:hypothetical protein P3W45_000578 [Vairimorpha bombi]|jgi:hypothetical protein
MKISLENEIRLKNLLRQKDKENECKTLSKEIENKEKNMLTHITKDYMNIINRCNDLKIIQNKIPHLLEQNETLISKYKENLYCIQELENEIRNHSELDSRIGDLLKELGIFQDFFKMVNTDFTYDKFYYFNLTQNLDHIKKLIPKFQKYRSYEEINEIYMEYSKKVEIENTKFFIEYQNQLCDESYNLGKKIIEMVKNSMEDTKILFNEILSFRDRYITPKILDLFYMNNKLGILDDFIDKFNLERKSIILKYEKNQNIMYRFTSEILNSYFLIQLNKNILDYYDFLLENMNDYFINNDVEEMLKAKDILIAIKILMNILHIEDDNLYETIGRISFEYFAKNNIKDCGREDFKVELDKFIDKSCKFIDKLNNNEINEIFVNKVDLYLKDFIFSSDTSSVIEDEKYLNKTVRNINKKFPNINFRSSDIFRTKIEEIKYKIVESKMDELERLFRDQDKDFSINLQKYVTNHNEIRKELYGIIKIKFIEMVNGAKDGSIDEKRMVACKATCFHKYLFNTDRHLFDDFRLVSDEANKF